MIPNKCDRCGRSPLKAINKRFNNFDKPTYIALIDGMEICNDCLKDYHDAIEHAKKIWRNK